MDTVRIAPWRNSPLITSLDDVDIADERLSVLCADAPKVWLSVARADAERLLLLDPGVIVLEDGERHWYDYGLCSFLPMLPRPAYAVACEFDREQPPTMALWWKPGPAQRHRLRTPPMHRFFALGLWGLSADDRPPTAWHPVTQPTVLAFTEPSSYDVAEVQLRIGSTEPEGFYVSPWAWAGFCPPEKEIAAARSRAVYQESLLRVRRRLCDKE